MSLLPTDIRLLDPLPIEVSRPLVLLRLGYRSAGQVPAKTARLLDDVITEARPLLEPRAVCAAFPVSRAETGGIAIGRTVRSASRSLSERLAGCDTAVLFAATIGPALEARVRAMNDAGDLTRALLADAYGSSAAIALGMGLETAVAREFRDLGLEPTRRYAPGYGDFELSVQAPLLRLVDAGRIGIALNDECLMIPAKSISGVIGGRRVRSSYGHRRPEDRHIPRTSKGGGGRHPLRRAMSAWWRGRDLNSRPLGYEPNELPGCSTPRRKARV